MVMATERIDDLRAFRDFVDSQLGNGGSSLTPEECLDLWIIQNSSDEEREESLAAIRQGLEDMYAGRTRSAREAIVELRRKHKLTELS
jgi:predicted transcriptional regulator